jgi:hypothetical protein
VHVAVILFNVFGLVAVPIGALCNWSFVHIGWWRVLHVLSLAAVAVQAVLGQACFLTVWQNELSATGQPATPLIVRWVNEVVYWELPIWVFAALYLLVFAYALALLWLVPTRRPRSKVRSGGERARQLRESARSSQNFHTAPPAHGSYARSVDGARRRRWWTPAR